MFSLIESAAASADPLTSRVYAGVFWPSLWFPDQPAPVSRALSATAESGPPAVAGQGQPATSPSGAQIARSLKMGYRSPAQRTVLDALGRLIDEGTAGSATESEAEQRRRLEEFEALLPQLIDSSPRSPEDQGEGAVLRQRAARNASAPARGDGKAGEPDLDRGLGEDLSHLWSNAKDALRAASYYEMKGRAGDVGQNGLGPLLEQLHRQSPQTRVHLIGHSFGARLVAYALAGISGPETSPVASLTLIQAAFSHWAFAANTPFDSAGGVSGYADRVHGPLVSTYSRYDWAVGRWYPRASLLFRDDSRDLTTPPDLARWGGIGADGFQGVNTGNPPLLDTGRPYHLASGFHAVDCSGVINDVTQSTFAGAHSDIQHEQVAWLVVSAAVAGAQAATADTPHP